MKKIAYYHTTLTDDFGTWSSIFMEQLKCMEDSGLLAELDELNISAITQNDLRNKFFASLFDTKTFSGTKMKVNLELYQNSFANDIDMINNIQSQDGRGTVTENVTLQKLWNKCQQEDVHVLYFHAKGLTAFWRALKLDNPQLFTQYFYGRQFSNWGVLTNWKTCVEALENYDTAGVFLQREYPCYGANFFWSKSSYIRTLANPATVDWWYEKKRTSANEWVRNSASERFKEEQWTLSNPNAKPYNLVELVPPGKFLIGEDPYLTYFPASKYLTREKNPTK